MIIVVLVVVVQFLRSIDLSNFLTFFFLLQVFRLFSKQTVKQENKT